MNKETQALIGNLAAQFGQVIVNSPSLPPPLSVLAMGVAVKMMLTAAMGQEELETPLAQDKIAELIAMFQMGLRMDVLVQMQEAEGNASKVSVEPVWDDGKLH